MTHLICINLEISQRNKEVDVNIFSENCRHYQTVDYMCISSTHRAGKGSFCESVFYLRNILSIGSNLGQEFCSASPEGQRRPRPVSPLSLPLKCYRTLLRDVTSRWNPPCLDNDIPELLIQ